MKRINNKIDFQETGRFVINDVSEVYYFKYFDEQAADHVKVTHLTSYQICDVYTNKNTPIEAYMPLNGNESSYKVVFDHKETRLGHRNTRAVLSKIKSNNRFNCHGLTFLDRMFWLELDNETSEIILKEDRYKECKLSDLKENGVALYYLPSGELHHSGRIMNGNLISKFGINDKVTIGEKHLRRLYTKVDFSQTRYFNP